MGKTGLLTLGSAVLLRKKFFFFAFLVVAHGLPFILVVMQESGKMTRNSPTVEVSGVTPVV